MKSYIIEGGKRLEGEVKVSGSKNASLPIIASCILNQNIIKLYNVPNIHDTQITLKILKFLGCKVKKNSNKIEINSKSISKIEIPEELMREMRSTVILAGAILARFKEVIFSYPGGCDIGARPIDLHLKAFQKLGIQVEEASGFIHCKTEKIVGADINLDFPSVGATENIILASIYADGITTISNAAMEPEIEDLAKCLNKMGAKIEGAGTNYIKITGVKKLKSISYSVMPDRIEAGTLLCAGAITGGTVKLLNVCADNLTPVIDKLEEAGCKIEVCNKEILLQAPKRLKPIQIKTMPYPGFPTDLQPQMGVVLSTAIGTSIINESIWTSRFQYTAELNKMGANIIAQGQSAVFEGVDELFGAPVYATDLRAGAALVIAGIAAKGVTEVYNLKHIDRGYENIEDKFSSLGANIKRVYEE